MSNSSSNELKAIVTLDNYLETPASVLRANCHTLSNLHYNSEYRRNDSNQVYGATDPVILDFSIRIGSSKKANIFYRILVEGSHYNYTFLYNVTFDGNDRISDHEGGMVVDAYVVKIKQEYTSQRTGHDSDEQIILHVKLLVRSITYLGDNKHFTVYYIK